MQGKRIIARVFLSVIGLYLNVSVASFLVMIPDFLSTFVPGTRTVTIYAKKLSAVLQL